MPDAAEPLSPQAADLVRRIARVFLDEPADLMDQVQAAVLAAADEPLRSEPVLAAEVAASTRANVLHWAASMERDPGGRVPANLTPEVLGIAREAFRRGIGHAAGKQQARQLGWRAFKVANWPGAEARRIRYASLPRAWPAGP